MLSPALHGPACLGAAPLRESGNPPIILHLDMDSFYASAEVLRRPELRGRPVVVGADPKKGTGRGVACTCSYEARAFGIRSAMPVSQAYILCPHAVFLPPDFPYYAGVSRAIMDELRSYGFPVLQVSIDEAYLDISACGHFGAAREIAQELRAAIHRRTGLTCSVGVAPGKVLAKIASDYQKPGGCTVIEPPRAQEFLSPLPVRKIPGVGRRAEAEFLELGIRTIGDLSRSDIQCLIGRFGRGAASLHSLASGIDGSGLEEPGDIRSVSRETTFDSDCSDPVELLRQLDHLTTAACRNLAGGSLRCRTVTIKIRYQGFITRTKSRTLPEYTDAEAPLLSCSRALFAGIFDGRKVRLLGVRLSSLTRPDHSQRTLGV